MNIWENFGVFYQSLDMGSLVVVWVLLFLFLFFVVATILLFSKNKELGRLLQEKTKREVELEAEKRALLEKKIDKVAVKDLNKDIKPIKDNSEIIVSEKNNSVDKKTSSISVDNVINSNDINNSKDNVSNKKMTMNNISDAHVSVSFGENNRDLDRAKLEQTKEILEDDSQNLVDNISVTPHVSVKTNPSNTNLYNSRNTIKDNRTRFQTSPINIVREETLDETMQKLKPIEIGETNTEPKRDNVNFVEEISRKMEQEVKPQAIELTDYELKQEEEAIISYDELMKNKDRLFKITDDEEDDAQFIEELKYFRNSLQ